MPFGSIQLRPGVNTGATPTLNQAGISVSNLIRFRDGLVEKVGGWTKYIGTATGSITRCLHAWRDLNAIEYLAVGSLESLLAIANSVVTDITPQTVTSNIAEDFSVTKGSKIVTVIDTNINALNRYDAVFFNTPISVGGLILAGLYQIRPTPSGTTYTFNASTEATATVANGGSVPTFNTTSGSANVTVTLADHGLVDGGRMVFPVATTVGGLVISGAYFPITHINSSSFTILAAYQATSTASGSMNGGDARLTYSVTAGPSSSFVSGGLGALGQYALGEGAITTTSVTSQVGTPITATDWTICNWGEYLLACPRGGAIWYWPAHQGFPTAVPVGSGPAINGGIFVAMPQQILVAWGSTYSIRNVPSDAEQDALLVRWSDQLDFTQWQVTSRTQAGSFHIPTGSEIRGGIQSSMQAYILTDVDCWVMQYLGPPLVFGFNQIGSNCGLIGPHAITNMHSRTYWMSSNSFFFTSGQGVQEIPCPVRDVVFQDLDLSVQHKCVAGANSGFNEIWFFYPSISEATGECDKYVKVNTNGWAWDYGTLPRSAWINSEVLDYPVGADPTTTYIQKHEYGYNADDTAMNSYFETAYTAYGDGENFSVVDYFEPDMKWDTVSGSSSAQIAVTLTAVPSPNGPTMVSGPMTMTSTTAYLTPRLRGRQIKWRMETTDSGSWWRIGNVRYRFTIDGRR